VTQREFVSPRTITPPRTKRGYRVVQNPGPEGTGVFTIISESGSPLYSFSSRHEAEAEASTLNGGGPAATPAKLLAAQVPGWAS
jgi:hypothetical protein